jgi:O-antigen ligase
MISWLLIEASSATSFMSLIIGICIFTGLSAIKRNVRHAGVIILFSIATLILLFLTFDVLEIIISSVGRTATLSGRTELWNEVINIDNNPLIGAGFDSFWLGERVRPLWEKHWWRPTQAHNGYIEIYLNLGLIGLFFIIGVVISTFVRVCKIFPFEFDYGRFQMAYLFVFLMTNITENIFIRGVMWFFFLCIAIDCPHYTPLKSATVMK